MNTPEPRYFGYPPSWIWKSYFSMTVKSLRFHTTFAGWGIPHNSLLPSRKEECRSCKPYNQNLALFVFVFFFFGCSTSYNCVCFDFCRFQLSPSAQWWRSTSSSRSMLLSRLSYLNLARLRHHHLKILTPRKTRRPPPVMSKMSYRHYLVIFDKVSDCANRKLNN